MELLSTHSCICYRGWLVSEALGLLKLSEDVGNWASTSTSITPAEPSVEPTRRNLNATQLKTGFVDHRRWQETGHLYFLVSDPVWLCFLFQPHAAILQLSNYIILFCFLINSHWFPFILLFTAVQRFGQLFLIVLFELIMTWFETSIFWYSTH